MYYLMEHHITANQLMTKQQRMYWIIISEEIRAQIWILPPGNGLHSRCHLLPRSPPGRRHPLEAGILHLGTHAAVKATLLAATKRGGGDRSHGRTKRKEGKPRSHQIRRRGGFRSHKPMQAASASVRLARGNAASWSNGAG